MEVTSPPAAVERGAKRSVGRRQSSADLEVRPRLRVLVLSNIPTPNNDALFRALAAQHDVQCLVAYCAEREPNRYWRLSAEKGYDHVFLSGVSIGGWVHVNPAIHRLIERFAPDVAILSGGYLMPTLHLGAAHLMARGIPWVYWGEELRHDERPLASRVLRAGMRWPIRRARGVFAIGERARRSYELAGVDPARIANFLYYADTSNFRASETERRQRRTAVREALRIADSDIAVLFCGQLIPRKGLDVLLRALARVPSGRAPLVTMVVGDGPQRESYQRLAIELGVADRVRFVGFREPEALPELFAAADVMVLPSRQDGWGLVISEAFAAQLPVISTDAVNAAVELVEPGRTGWIVPADDDAALADAIADFVARRGEQTAMRERIGEVAREQAPEAAAPRMAALLRAVSRGETIDGR